MLRKILFSLLLCVGFGLIAPPPFAQDTPLESLDTWGRNRGWEGVGLLNIDNAATCTAVMIKPDMVLTAAHCFFKGGSDQPIDPRNIEFRAGWRDGKSIASRRGKSAIVHPNYKPDAGLSARQIRYDVALLQLADPIPATHAEIFQSESGVGTGAHVSVVSYGKGRNDAPSRQRSCDVLETQKGVVAMSCDVVPGSSGAPVFSLDSGRPRIVSLVSALGVVNGRQVSFGMDLEAPLADVMTNFRAGRGVFPKRATKSRRITVGGEHTAEGARFLRP